ncbi:MAG: thioredoxin domain-containing protein [Candidatus Curtissbacteria bacterium]|nr:thioredoxin domain-containing protein [Candidatus Curtissbacteria bacterium]
MTGENKFLIGAGLLTVTILVVGVSFLGRGDKKTGEVASSNINLTEGATHTKGEASASATIVEFGDFQCPACGQAYPIVKKFLEDKGSSVYFVNRNFPLSQVHPNAIEAARAAEAAGKQGKYWEMHDILYEKQSEWSSLTDAREKFLEYAQGLDLNLDQFKGDRDDAIGVINQDAKLGKDLGVQSTPTFFINGKMYPGVLTYEKLSELTQ